jgi:hypothetical protein
MQRGSGFMPAGAACRPHVRWRTAWPRTPAPRPAFAGHQVAQQRRRGAQVDLDGALGRMPAARLFGRGRRRCAALVQQHLSGQAGHGLGHRGREQQRLPARRQQRQHAPARRQSPGRAGGRPRPAPAVLQVRQAQRPLATRSSSRPGVATTRCAPPRSAIICGLIDTPPTATTIFSCGASSCTPSPICAASSRVGARIKRTHAARALRSAARPGSPSSAAAAAAGRRRSCRRRWVPAPAGRGPCRTAGTTAGRRFRGARRWASVGG